MSERCEDLISRRKAITEFSCCELTPDGGIDANYAIDFLKHLPSVQPEPCEDAVSRHRLLSDLEELIVAWEKYPVMAEQRKGVEAAIGYVKTIPSAQPEPLTDKEQRIFLAAMGREEKVCKQVDDECCRDCREPYEDSLVRTCHEIIRKVKGALWDLISRQAAISAICNACGKIDCDKMDKCEKLQLPPANCSEFPNNSDTISRQAAIDAILAVTGNSSVRELYEHVQEHGLSDMWSGGVNAAIDVIIAVPAAQPDITDEQAIGHLQASGWMQSHDKQMYEMGLKERLADDSDSYDALLPSVQPTQNERVNSNNALDTISRQAAIDLFPNDALEWDTKGGYIAPHLARQMIEELPSAQPEIVRCHKCIHWDRDTVRQNSNDAGWWNEAICERHSDEIWTSWKDADWFCADAERRPDAETEV